jgi:tetratricopeptide (TPR) repeat protein
MAGFPAVVKGEFNPFCAQFLRLVVKTLHFCHGHQLVLRSIILGAFWLLSFTSCRACPLFSLPATTTAILDHIYSGRDDLAISEARQLQQHLPEHPLGYLLEAEALWWKIWCSSAEYKYGMTMPRHREKIASDQQYLDLTAKALSLADAQLKTHESAEMYFYAGMAEALAVRLYGIRGDMRYGARAGVRAREDFLRALALDPSLADADMGLGLYEYYVDTLSSAARVLRFFMGIPGGSKEDGIRKLQRAIAEGELTSADARFYLAINLHNYDQRYEEALQVIIPLVQRYPENPLFLLAEGDLYAKLGRKALALASYRAAASAAGNLADLECRRRLEWLVQQSMAPISAAKP